MRFLSVALCQQKMTYFIKLGTFVLLYLTASYRHRDRLDTFDPDCLLKHYTSKHVVLN